MILIEDSELRLRNLWLISFHMKSKCLKLISSQILVTAFYKSKIKIITCLLEIHLRSKIRVKSDKDPFQKANLKDKIMMVLLLSSPERFNSGVFQVTVSKSARAANR